MIPFYFGTRERRLFGVYEPAHSVAARPRAAVFCYPWGQEYLHAHRTMRQLATALVAKGVHVLRFDYFGTGDSAGEMEEASVEGWSADVETAIEEIRDMTGASKVTLIGLRLGAAMAAHIAAKRWKDIEALILWDPILGGRQYVEELLGASAKRKRATSGGPSDVLGFPLTESMRTQLESLDLMKSMSQVRTRSMFVLSLHPESGRELKSAVGQIGSASPEVLEVDCEAPWSKPCEGDVVVVPVNIIQSIAKWAS